MTDSLKELAEAGEAVMGDTAWLNEPAARPGNWLVIGAIAAIVPLVVFHWSWWLTLIIAFVAGYFANERERRQIIKRLEARERLRLRSV